MSRFKRARGPAAMQAACLALDAALLRPEDIAALLTCLPTAEEEEVLAAHSTGPADLAPADEFQWRLRAVPRCEARLASFRP